VPPPGLALRKNGHDWCATPRFSITPWASSGDPLALLTQFVAVRIADGRAGACDEKRVASAVVALPILTLDPSPAFAHGEGVLLDNAAVIAATLIALVLFFAMSRVSATTKVVIALAVPATMVATVWMVLKSRRSCVCPSRSALPLRLRRIRSPNPSKWNDGPDLRLDAANVARSTS